MKKNQIQGKHVRCKSCGWEFKGNFCPNCGQSAKTKRITVRGILTDLFPDVFHLDNKFVHTCIELLHCPGLMMRRFLDGDRAKFCKPVPLLFIIVAVYLVINHYFGLPTDTGNTKMVENPKSVNDMNRVLYALLFNIQSTANQTWFTLAVVVFTLFPNYIVFKASEYGRHMNLAEHFCVLVFLECQNYLVGTLLFPVNWLTDGWFYNNCSIFILLFFFVWDFKQLLNISWWKSFKLSAASWALLIVIFLSITTVLSVTLSQLGVMDGIIEGMKK